MLDLGAIEKNLAKQAIRDGQPIPDRIAKAPQIPLGLNFYLNAFFELDSDRNNAFSLSPLSWSTLRSYAEYYELDQEQAEDFFFVIRKIDNAHLDRMEKKEKAKSKKGGKKK